MDAARPLSKVVMMLSSCMPLSKLLILKTGGLNVRSVNAIYPLAFKKAVSIGTNYDLEYIYVQD